MADTNSVLVFTDGEDLTADVLNSAFSNLDLRTRAIESLSISYQQAIDTLNQFGLQRLNDALQPVYDALIQLAQLGAVFTATSSTSNTVGLGTASFTLDAADKDRFAAAAYITAIDTSSGSVNTMAGTLQSYDRTRGVISVLVQSYTGTLGATSSSWLLTPGSDFVGSKTYTDNAITALIGTADGAGNTLGELEALISTNTSAITANAATAASATAQAAATAQANATANALALAIALG